MEESDPHFFSGIFSPQPYDLRTVASQRSLPHLNEGQTPRLPIAIVSHASTPVDSPLGTPGRQRRRKREIATRPKLRLLRLEEWDQKKAYDEDPPTCLHYTMTWCAMLGKDELIRDTETDLVLNPSAYWQLFLHRRVEGLVQKELTGNTYKLNHVVVIVSLSGRSSEPKLVKHFEADIEWQCVEKHLTQWSDQFQSGKKLLVDLAFHYVELIQQSNEFSSTRGANQRGRRGARRGSSSATQRMRSRLSSQVNAEEESTGEAAKWPHYYSIMRCPDACPKGPHCFIDPITKKHIKMFTRHLEDLIHHKDLSIEKFQSQADIPDDFRRQILTEERQRRETDHGKSIKSSAGPTPITINNHFPDHASYPASEGASGKPTSAELAAEPLDLPSPLDQAVRDYCEWQKSRVSDPLWKADVDTARDVLLAQRRDLRQIYTKRETASMREAGVPIGVAERIADEVPLWIKKRTRET